MNRRHLLQAIAAGLVLPSSAAWAQKARRSVALRGVTVHDWQPYSLAQERGKVVLLFYWSTACAVCRDKLPEFRANYESWRDKGFQLVAVNVDAKPDDFMRFSELTRHVVSARQQFPMLWRGDSRHADDVGPITHLPTSLILDRAGRVVKEVHGRIEPALWDDIAELVLA